MTPIHLPRADVLISSMASFGMVSVLLDRLFRWCRPRVKARKLPSVCHPSGEGRYRPLPTRLSLYFGSMRTPGFITMLGSTVCFTARSADVNSSGRCWSYQGRWNRPTAWW